MYYSNVRSSKGLSIDEKRLKYHLELQSYLETWELCSDHNNLTTVVHRSFSVQTRSQNPLSTIQRITAW